MCVRGKSDLPHTCSPEYLSKKMNYSEVFSQALSPCPLEKNVEKLVTRAADISGHFLNIHSERKRDTEKGEEKKE